MQRELRDPDVQVLAAIAGELEVDYAGGDLGWMGSPFAWIKTRPSRQIGTIGEKLVAGWCAAQDLDVTKAADSDADRVIEGLRVEIKFSTLWESGFYKFQQLRDQRYDVAICLGISPFDAHCWVLQKEFIMRSIGKVPGLTPQHGGSRGSDTAWLQVNPSAVQAWLAPYGGRLRDALRLLKDLSGRR